MNILPRRGRGKRPGGRRASLGSFNGSRNEEGRLVL